MLKSIIFGFVSNPELLGEDPESVYFIDYEGRPVSLVVENATGEPRFAIVNGTLVPYAAWKETLPESVTIPEQGFTIKSGDAGFSANIKVS